MKYFFILLIIFCASFVQAQSTFSIYGHSIAEYENVTIKLLYRKANQSYYSTATTSIHKGKFTFSGTITYEYEKVFLQLNRNAVQLEYEFLVSKGINIIELNKKVGQLDEIDLCYKKIPFVKEQYEYKSQTDVLEKELNKCYEEKRRNPDDSLIQIKCREIRKAITSRKIQYIREHKYSFFSLFYFNEEILHAPLIHPDTLLSTFNSFDKELQYSKLGKDIYAVIEGKRKLSIGNAFESFSFCTNQYQKLDLKNLAPDKNILLTFWASWCGPCKKNISMLRELDSLYKNRLQLISVSLDQEKEKWGQALEKYPMPWPQTCDIEGFIPNIRLSHQYNIELIPLYLLINKEGKIVYNSIQLEDDNYLLLKRILIE